MRRSCCRSSPSRTAPASSCSASSRRPGRPGRHCSTRPAEPVPDELPRTPCEYLICTDDGDGRPVGSCWLGDTPEQLRVLDIAVLPEHRRRGVARAVLGSLCDQAAAAGQAGPALGLARQRPARELYRSLGFDRDSDGRQADPRRQLRRPGNGYLELRCCPAHLGLEPALDDRSTLSYRRLQRPGRAAVHDAVLRPARRRRMPMDLAVELTECARSTVPGATRSFDLTFRAGPDAPREQGNYLLEPRGLRTGTDLPGAGASANGRLGVPCRLQPTRRRMRMCHE